MKTDDATLEDRIFLRFLGNLSARGNVPAAVVDRLRSLYDQRKIDSLEDVLTALRDGSQENAEDSKA